MTFRLEETDMSEPIRIGQGIWLRSRLPDDLGDCTNDMCLLDDGLALAYAHYRPRHDLMEHRCVQRQDNVLIITVGLEGESSTLGVNGQRFDFVAGHSTLAASSTVRGARRFPAGQSIRQLRLIASETLLSRYRLEHLLDGIRHDHSAINIHFGPSAVAVQRMALSLEHLHHRDAGVLDLQIAALGLLAEQTRAFQTPIVATSELREDDEARMLRARDILMSQYDRQLTIPYLCTAVGVNEFKLKQGFRKLFGTSPHRMLVDIRMKKAWELLESGLHVSSVAYRIGYQHLSSFSAAFERHYGRMPKSVSKPCHARKMRTAAARTAC